MIHARCSFTSPTDAHRLLDDVRATGIDFDDIVVHQLVDEGVDAFAQSFDTLIDSLGHKLTELASESSADQASR